MRIIKLVKLIVLLVSILLILTILSMFSFNEVQSTTATPLHISGNQVLMANGTVLNLRGVDYSYFIDSEGGSWMLSDGNIEFTTNPMDIVGVSDFLNLMQAWNVTIIRVPFTMRFWIDNSKNFQSNIEYFITQAAHRGIYVDFCATCNNGPLPWKASDNTALKSSAEFVDMWGNIGNTLKNYPSVMFELLNEPDPADSSWFTVAQQCIVKMRSVGASQPIIIQWGTGLYDEFNGPAGGFSWQNWVTAYSLTDPLGNIIYSEHIYTQNNINNYTTGSRVYYGDIADIQQMLTDNLVLQTAALHPVFIGEFGCDLYAADLQTEYQFFNNTLTLLNEYGIGYAIEASPPWHDSTEWGLVQYGVANYALDEAGVIAVQHMGGMNYSDYLALKSPVAG